MTALKSASSSVSRSCVTWITCCPGGGAAGAGFIFRPSAPTASADASAHRRSPGPAPPQAAAEDVPFGAGRAAPQQLRRSAGAGGLRGGRRGQCRCVPDGSDGGVPGGRRRGGRVSPRAAHRPPPRRAGPGHAGLRRGEGRAGPLRPPPGGPALALPRPACGYATASETSGPRSGRGRLPGVAEQARGAFHTAARPGLCQRRRRLSRPARSSRRPSGRRRQAGPRLGRNPGARGSGARRPGPDPRPPRRARGSGCSRPRPRPAAPSCRAAGRKASPSCSGIRRACCLLTPPRELSVNLVSFVFNASFRKLTGSTM